MAYLHAETHSLKYDIAGDSNHQPVIFLHGILGTFRSELFPLMERLSDKYFLIGFDFSMHGKSPMLTPAMSTGLFCENIFEIMRYFKIESAHIVGYSLGGYIGLQLARMFPGSVQSLLMRGTKFFWDEKFASEFSSSLDPKRIEEKQPKWAEILRSNHDVQGEGHWKILCKAASDYVRTLSGAFPDEDVRAITIPVCVSIGDRDELVPLNEAARLFHLLPKGSLSVLPSTRHPIALIDYEMFAWEVEQFLKKQKK